MFNEQEEKKTGTLWRMWTELGWLKVYAKSAQIFVKIAFWSNFEVRFTDLYSVQEHIASIFW